MPQTHRASRSDLPKTEWRWRETEQGSEPPGAGSASLSRPLDHALEERTDRSPGCGHPGPEPLPFSPAASACLRGDHSFC